MGEGKKDETIVAHQKSAKTSPLGIESNPGGIVE